MDLFGQIAGTVLLTGIVTYQGIITYKHSKERKELERSFEAKKKNKLKKV